MLPRTNVKAALAMKWLQLKKTNSKQKAAQRVAAVLEGIEETAAQAKATVKRFVFDDLASLGRHYSLHLDPGSEQDAYGVSALGNYLQTKHSSVIGIFLSRQGLMYPVAGYRSGGMRGRNPHIYLFLPGIGEFKGIKTEEFVTHGSFIDENINLGGGDRITKIMAFPARLLTVGDALDEPADEPESERVDLSQLAAQSDSGGASVGQIVVEDGNISVAGLAHRLNQSGFHPGGRPRNS